MEPSTPMARIGATDPSSPVSSQIPWEQLWGNGFAAVGPDASGQIGHPHGNSAPAVALWAKVEVVASHWWDTCRLILLSPRAFWPGMAPGRTLKPALLFFAVCAVVAGVVAPVVTGAVEKRLSSRMLNLAPLPAEAQQILDGQNYSLEELLPSGQIPGAEDMPENLVGLIAPPELPDLKHLITVLSVLSWVFALLMPVASLLSAAVTFQGGALLFARKRRSFAETLRVTAYAHAPVICLLIPFIGGLVFTVWFSLLLVQGLAEIHGVTRARAVLCLAFWPTLLLGILSIGALMLTLRLLSEIPAAL
ncbi:MAG: hypothetical protein AMXMBFR13_34520 [Phycisphaerae bacterium]